MTRYCYAIQEEWTARLSRTVAIRRFASQALREEWLRGSTRSRPRRFVFSGHGVPKRDDPRWTAAADGIDEYATVKEGES